MAQNHLIEWLSVILLFVFGISMIIQGYFILYGKGGYKNAQLEKIKMNNVRRQVEELFKNK